MGVAAVIKPSPLFETGHIDHESVAFPLRHRVAEPGGIGVLGKLTTIGENLAVLVEFFKEHDGFARRLDDLEWETTHQHCIRAACNATVVCLPPRSPGGACTMLQPTEAWVCRHSRRQCYRRSGCLPCARCPR